MQINFFSNSIKSLNLDLMTTSSEKFEYESAYNLAKNAGTTVNIYSAGLDYGRQEGNTFINLFGIGGKSKWDIYRNLDDFLENKIKHIGTVFIFYGYDLFQVLNLIYLKYKYRFKLLGFIFDSHIGAIEHLAYVKKIVANTYFHTSINLLKLLDGYILFQKAAASELRLKKPFYVTKPGIDPNSIGIDTTCSNRKSLIFTVTYLGSLLPYNGIDALLNSFALSTDPEIRLRVFGNGILQKQIIDYSKRDERVYYGGLINHKQVKDELKTTNLLINLRDPESYICKFAYPSKLVEYMASGIPVLSTDLDFDAEMRECLYLVKKLEPNEILRMINHIKEKGPEYNAEKAKKAKKYIIENNNWNEISKGLYKYISGFGKENGL
jgi:glycosyltransferase involved in cell wall biosynthesis